MAEAKPKHVANELAHLASEAYDRHVRPVLRPEDDNKFVAVDVHTGDYEIHENDYQAVVKLRNRCPSAEIWLFRVGQPAAFRMGGRSMKWIAKNNRAFEK